MPTYTVIAYIEVESKDAIQALEDVKMIMPDIGARYEVLYTEED